MENQLPHLLEAYRKEACFSAYQLVANKKGDALSLSGGTTSYWEPHAPVTAKTLFDLGSITKALVTTSVLARWVDQGKIAVEEPLEKLAPQWKTTPFGKCVVADLLSHEAGLVAWYPFYEKGSFEKTLLANPEKFLVANPNEKAVYSDVGFLLLGSLIASQAGSVEKAFESEVVQPLGLKSVGFGPVDVKVAVATEYSLEQDRLLHGEVFDENSRSLGGKTSHAGIFSSAESLVAWCEAWLQSVLVGTSWLSQKTAKRFVSKRGVVKDSPWALGWDTPSAVGSSAGSRFSKTSFGHLGYPGTSVWLDPERQGYCVFLTNRVHPSRYEERIREIRPAVHDLVSLRWDGK